MDDVTHDTLSGNSLLHKTHVFVHSMWLINDSKQGLLLKTPAVAVFIAM